LTLRVIRRFIASIYQPSIPSKEHEDKKVPNTWFKVRNNITEIKKNITDLSQDKGDWRDIEHYYEVSGCSKCG
jgi:hypothetical protein